MFMIYSGSNIVASNLTDENEVIENLQNLFGTVEFEDLRVIEYSHRTINLGIGDSDDGWIDWKGGKCPVNNNTLVEYMIKDSNTVGKDYAKCLRWSSTEYLADIVKYRVVS